MAAPIIRHYGVVRNGKVRLHNLKLYNINKEALEGKQIEFTIKEVHESPTLDQYAYYRGAVIETALTAECFGGWSGDEVDKELSDMFLGIDRMVEYTRKDGDKVNKITRYVPSKDGSFPKKSMAEFIDKCIMFLAQENVIVHTPEEYKLNKYQTLKKND